MKYYEWIKQIKRKDKRKYGKSRYRPTEFHRKTDLVAWLYKKSVYIWNRNTEELITQIHVGYAPRLKPIQWHPVSQSLLVITEEGTAEKVDIYKLGKGSVSENRVGKFNKSNLRWNPTDENVIIKFGKYSEEIEVIDVSSGQCKKVIEDFGKIEKHILFDASWNADGTVFMIHKSRKKTVFYNKNCQKICEFDESWYLPKWNKHFPGLVCSDRGYQKGACVFDIKRLSSILEISPRGTVNCVNWDNSSPFVLKFKIGLSKNATYETYDIYSERYKKHFEILLLGYKFDSKCPFYRQSFPFDLLKIIIDMVDSIHPPW